MNITDEQLFLTLLPVIYSQQSGHKLSGYQISKITMGHVASVRDFLEQWEKDAEKIDLTPPRF